MTIATLAAIISVCAAVYAGLCAHVVRKIGTTILDENSRRLQRRAMRVSSLRHPRRSK